MSNTAVRGIALFALLSLSLAACKGGEGSAGDEHLSKANQLFKKQDFGAAGAEFEQSLQQNPKQDLKIYEKGAFAYKMAGNPDKCAEILLKTLPLRDEAGQLETYKNIASSYLDAKVPEKAESYFLEVMKRSPKDEETLAWLAEIASLRGGARSNTGTVDTSQLDLAIERYDQLIALNQKATAPYINKRIALIRYINYIGEQAQIALLDAAKVKKDKKLAAALKENADKLVQRHTALRAALEDNNRKLGELNRVLKAEKAAPAK